MDTSWASRPTYPNFPQSPEYRDSFFEKGETEFEDQAKYQDPCFPGRSFELPFGEEYEYDEDQFPGEEGDYDSSDGATGYSGSQAMNHDDFACGDSDESAQTSFYRPPPYSTAGREGFVGDCVNRRRQINESIRRINAFTTLDEFIAEVSPLTDDNGAAMKEIMTAEVASFREFVKGIYKTRIQHKEDQMDEDFLRLKEHYKQKFSALNKKITSAIRAIERVIPDFDQAEYKKTGYVYIHDEIEESQKRARKDDSDDKPFAHGQIGREIRAAEHKAKWFLKETQRLERKNDKATYLLNNLYKELASISDKVALAHRRLHTYNVQLEKYACCLKSKICRNQELLDHLVQASSGSGATKCFTVKPEDVIEDCRNTYDCN